MYFEIPVHCPYVRHPFPTQVQYKKFGMCLKHAIESNFVNGIMYPNKFPFDQNYCRILSKRKSVPLVGQFLRYLFIRMCVKFWVLLIITVTGFFYFIIIFYVQ